MVLSIEGHRRKRILFVLLSPTCHFPVLKEKAKREQPLREVVPLYRLMKTTAAFLENQKLKTFIIHIVHLQGYLPH